MCSIEKSVPSICSLACKRVAAVGEERSLVGQHDDDRSRAGEAREPSHALFRRRHVFVLVLVGAREEEGVETLTRELRTQCLQASRRLCLVAFVLEGLEFCFEHSRNLSARFPRI
jgi:hypothetical protein